VYLREEDSATRSWGDSQTMRGERVFSLLTEKPQAFGEFSAHGLSAMQSLAACLTAGMPRRLYLAGRLRYSLDPSCAADVATELYMVTARQAASEGWRDHAELVALAVLELGDRRSWTHKLRAWVMEVPERTWYRRYSGPYEVVYGRLNDWAEGALTYARRRR